MKQTNTPPVYLLCFGEIGRLTQTFMPARLKQQVNIIQFPIILDPSKREAEKPHWLPIVQPNGGKQFASAKRGDSLMHRLLFSRQQPLIICILNPSLSSERIQAEENISVLQRAGLNVLGLFLDDGFVESAEIPQSLLNRCLGYTQIQLVGHGEDKRTHRRLAQAFINQIELLFHLATYPDREPSFMRILPLLMKESPHFILASGFAEESLFNAGNLLTRRLDKHLKKPVRGRSLVMVLSNKRHLGFQEISIVNSACVHLLGQRMHIKSGGNGHPHLRKGQYLLIGMVNTRRVHTIG